MNSATAKSHVPLSQTPISELYKTRNSAKTHRCTPKHSLPPPPEKMSSHSNRDLKQRVLTSLDRLGDRDTQAQATAELDLISHSLPETSLPTFLSCLLSVDSSHRSPVRVHSLRLISSLAASHGPHLSPHLPKILPSLLRRLRDPDTAVRSACSEASSSLARHLTSSPFSAFLDPLLASLLSEQDLNAQIGASLCLSAAVDSSLAVHAPDLRRALPKLLKLARSDAFRAKPALLTLIASVVSADGGSVVNGPGLMASVVACAVELLSSDDWAARKAAAEVLEKVALAVPNRQLVVEVKTLCLTALDKRRFDKVKIAREAMNRALGAWKAVNDLSSEDSPLSLPQSSPPKDKRNVMCSSPESSDRQNFGFKTPEPKKNWINSRSSLSDCSTVTGSPPVSNCSGDASSQTPQLNKSKSDSRSSVSSLSDDSTVAVAKKESLQNASGKKAHVRKPHGRRKPLDWKVEEDAAETMSAGVGFEQRNSESVESVENSSGSIGSSSKKTFNNSLYEDHGRRSGTPRGFGTRVVPLQDSQRVDGEANEQVYDNSADFEDISLIRKQLIQIERQQANLTELLQRFMGTSQSGINSLETRVSGLEKALDGISHNLAMQGCRIPNESAGNSCCSIRGAEFLSPKFWRKNENGRFAASSSCYSGNMNSAPHKDDNVHIRDMRDITRADLIRDSGRNSDVNLPTTRSMTKCMKGISQRRACSVGSLDGASPRACTTPVVQRT